MWSRRGKINTFKLGGKPLPINPMPLEVADAGDVQVPSRSSSPKSFTDKNFLTGSQLPAPMQEFFNSVSQEGYPESMGKTTRVQPWRALWDGPQQPSKDGKLIVACPQTCAYGRHSFFWLHLLIEKTYYLTYVRA
jgi:hypothetical protein